VIVRVVEAETEHGLTHAAQVDVDEAATLVQVLFESVSFRARGDATYLPAGTRPEGAELELINIIKNGCTYLLLVRRRAYDEESPPRLDYETIDRLRFAEPVAAGSTLHFTLRAHGVAACKFRMLVVLGPPAREPPPPPVYSFGLVPR
jgi:hypothetical protein